MIDLAKCWTDHELVIVDTETSSPDPSSCELIEVAAVRMFNRQIIGEFSELIRPASPIPAEATEIHGITDAMVEHAPTAAQVQPALADFCRGAVPVGYNSVYDKEVLRRHMSPMPVEPISWIDVYVIVASKRVDKFVKGPGRLKLSNVCARRGIAHESQHRALGDARATAQLLLHLLDNTRVRPCPLGKMIDHTDKMRAEQQRDFASWRSRQPARENA